MDKIFKNLDLKMPLTPPPGVDENPFLKAFENSIDIYNGFNTLQTVDSLPPPLSSPKGTSVTTMPKLQQFQPPQPENFKLKYFLEKMTLCDA